jgi:hypothetical protein
MEMVRLEEEQIIKKLDLILIRAKKIRKRLSIFYVLKAFVVLGKGWHTIHDVWKKAIEISGNPKLKYYPIQDAIKYNFAVLEEQREGKKVGNLRVKLKDELYDIIKKEIDRYLKELGKIK